MNFLRRHRVGRELGIFIVLFLLTSLMTWPWVKHLGSSVPDAGDPYMIAWTLWWDFHQTFHHPLHLFQANVFFPYRYTLAFSEHDYGIAMLFFPLFALGFKPLTVEICATFFGIVCCGYGGFRCARTVTGSSMAGWIAGIFFAFVPLRFTILSHLHYLFAAWMPLLVEALVLFARERTWKRATWLGIAFAMNGLTCITWLILSLVPFLPCGVYLITRYRLWKEKAFWLRGGIALVCAGLVLLPFLLPYHYVSELYGFVWSREEAIRNSPHLSAWITAEGRNHLWRGLGAHLHGGAPLFPGLLVILLSLVACLAAKQNAARYQDGMWLGLIWTATGFLMSLGMNGPLFPVLFDHIFLFRTQRIPWRSAMLAYVGLALLAGIGVACLTRKRSRLIALVFVLAFLFELRAAPLQLVRGAVKPNDVTKRLKETPMRGGILELPTGREEQFEHSYMLRAADHGRPLINGSSSFIPPNSVKIEQFVAASPIPDRLFDLLEKIHTSYIVLHDERIPTERRLAYHSFFIRGVAADRLRFIRSYRDGKHGRDYLYAVTKTEPQTKSEEPPPAVLTAHTWDELLRQDPVHLLGEFQEQAQLIYRIYKAGFGRMPRLDELLPDAEDIGRGVVAGLGDQNERLEQNIRAFLATFVARDAFRERYQQLDNPQFVEAVVRNAGISLDGEQLAALTRELSAGAPRSDVLLKVARDGSFTQSEYNRSLIVLHYFGYLHRNPGDPPDHDLSGISYWLEAIEHAGGDTKILTRAFADSIEYRARSAKEMSR